MSRRIVLFVLPFFFAACSSEADLNEILVEPRMVLNSLIMPDQPVVITVSSTVPVSENIYPEIEDAVVSLYKNEEWLENLTPAGHGKYQAVHTPETGASYTLTVEAPGFEPVKAVETLPESIIKAMDVK